MAARYVRDSALVGGESISDDGNERCGVELTPESVRRDENPRTSADHQRHVAPQCQGLVNRDS